MKRSIFLLLFFLTILEGKAQEISHNNNVWFFSLNNIQFSEKWSYLQEFHWRTTDWMQTKQQLLIRPGLKYKVNKNLSFSGGYTFIATYPYGDFAVVENTPEHQLWEQFSLKHKIGKLNISHRYRLENRWIGLFDLDLNADGFAFTNRFRYRLLVSIPFVKIGEKQSKLILYDELWFVLQNNLAPSAINQNWIGLNWSYPIYKSLDFRLGYQHQYLWVGNNVESNPTVMFSFKSNIKVFK